MIVFSYYVTMHRKLGNEEDTFEDVNLFSKSSLSSTLKHQTGLCSEHSEDSHDSLYEVIGATAYSNFSLGSSPALEGVGKLGNVGKHLNIRLGLCSLPSLDFSIESQPAANEMRYRKDEGIGFYVNNLSDYQPTFPSTSETLFAQPPEKAGTSVLNDFVSVGNLDEFFKDFYTFYEVGGFHCFLVNRLSHLITILFTTGMTYLLMYQLNWTELLKCKDEETCKPLVHYLNAEANQAVSPPSSSVASPLLSAEPVAEGKQQNKLLGSVFWMIAFDWGWSVYEFVLHLLLFFILLFWLLSIYYAVAEVKRMRKVHQFYRNILLVDTADLQTLDWFEVVEKLLEAEKRGKTKLVANEREGKLTALSIAQRLTRKENYFTAMLNLRILPFNSDLQANPMRSHGAFKQRYQAAFKSHQNFHLTKTIETLFFRCVFEDLFTERLLLNRRLISNPKILKNRFRFYAALCLMLLPFLMMFLLIYYFLRYAEEFYSRSSHQANQGRRLSQRKFNRQAVWKFREFNELPHSFEQRVNSYETLSAVEDYLAFFPNKLFKLVTKIVNYLSNGILSLLLLFTLLNEEILLYVSVFHRNLLFYLAVVTVIASFTRASSAERDLRSLSAAATIASDKLSCSESSGKAMRIGSEFKGSHLLRMVIARTHYFPRHWRNKLNSSKVRDKFLLLYESRLLLLFREMWSLLLLPYLFGIILPSYAAKIIDFITDSTVYVPDVGDICVFSKLEVFKYGDKDYGGKNETQLVQHEKQAVGIDFELPLDMELDLRAIEDMAEETVYVNDGKLEKSFLEFYLSHPNEITRILMKMKKTEEPRKGGEGGGGEEESILLSILRDYLKGIRAGHLKRTKKDYMFVLDNHFLMNTRKEVTRFEHLA